MSEHDLTKEGGGQIIDFVNGPNPSLRTKGYGRYCSHRRVGFDKNERRVECDGCGKVLDPFDWLANTLVGDWDHYTYELRQMKSAAERARNELEELKRRERNARARVKRWESRADTETESGEGS